MYVGDEIDRKLKLQGINTFTAGVPRKGPQLQQTASIVRTKEGIPLIGASLPEPPEGLAVLEQELSRPKANGSPASPALGVDVTLGDAYVLVRTPTVNW